MDKVSCSRKQHLLLVGIEPGTYRSRIRRFTTAPQRSTSLGKWKFILDMDSSSHCGLIIASAQEAKDSSSHCGLIIASAQEAKDSSSHCGLIIASAQEAKDSSSHCGLIIASAQEANRDNLRGMAFGTSFLK